MTGRADQAAVTLKRSNLFSYGAMALGPAVFSLAINVMIPQLYAKELGLALTDIGVALLLIRVFDSLSDQVVGYLSDRTHSPIGARKPWILVGVSLTLLSCYFLFNPPQNITLTYFVAWRVVYDVGWTMFSVAYTAWGAELSRTYADRSKVNGAAGMATNAGVMLKNLLPIGLFWLGVVKTSAFTMQVFAYIFWIMLPIIVALTAWSALGTPTGSAPRREGMDFRGLLRSLRVNRPFFAYQAGFLTAMFGSGFLALMFTFYDSYLKLGPYYPYLMMGFGAVTVFAIPVWVRIANRVGKHRAYALALFGAAASVQCFWFVDPSRHSQAMVAALGAVVLLFVAFTTACAFVSPGAMLADVVDYGTWRTGEARAGSYFAFNSLITKVTQAVGGGAAFMMLGHFHYSVRPGAENGPGAVHGLLFTVLAMPGMLNVLAALIFWRFPLTAARHDILRRRIDARAAIAAEPGEIAEPVSGATAAQPAT